MGDNDHNEPPEAPSETKIRLGNAVRTGLKWALIAAVAVLALSLVGGALAGSAILSGGPLAWIGTFLGVKTGAAGAVLGGAIPYVLGAIGLAGLAGGAMGYSDDQKYQAKVDEHEREGQKSQLKVLERQRAAATLGRQSEESQRQAQALGMQSGDPGPFMPPNVPYGSGGSGGGRGIF